MRSKLAVWSFIISLTPIVFSILLLIGTVITSVGDPIKTVEPLEIVDGEIVGGGEVRDTGERVSLNNFTLSRIIGWLGFVFFYSSALVIFISTSAIVLGIIGLVKIRKDNLEGRGFAIAGIIISGILIIFSLSLIILNWGVPA